MKEILLTNKNHNEVGSGALDVHNGGGIIAWLDGEHGEEIVLRRAICKTLEKCADEGKDIAFDVQVFAKLGYNFSYLDSVFEEVVCSDGKASSDKVDRALFYNINIDTEKIEAFEQHIFNVYEERENLSFTLMGDEFADKFRSYLSEHKEKPFGNYIMQLAKRKGFRSRSQICMASGVSKYTMSKLVNSLSRPSKDTLAALAIGLKLDIGEAEEMCNQVGYHLGDMDISDKAVKFFIKEKVYDIDIVNYCLYHLGYTPLGEKPRDVYITRGTDAD